MCCTDRVGRLWCPFEICQASLKRVKLTAAASSQYTAALDADYNYFLQDVVAGDARPALLGCVSGALLPSCA